MRGRKMVAALAIVFLAAVCACGARRGGGRGSSRENADFRCNGRRAGYVAKGGLLYAEQGVLISCEGDQPRLTTYTLTSAGAREEKGGIIRASAWEEAWKQFVGAGWKNLESCSNPGAGRKDPVYTFSVADAEETRNVSCPGRELPFPYDRLRDGLDSLVGEL